MKFYFLGSVLILTYLLTGCSTTSPAERASEPYENLDQRKSFDHFVSDMNEDMILKSVRDEDHIPETMNR